MNLITNYKKKNCPILSHKLNSRLLFGVSNSESEYHMVSKATFRPRTEVFFII